MKTIEIVGYKRANLGKIDAKNLRAEGMVPCVIYGGEEQVHFYAPAILFRELVYTAEAHFVKVNVEGKEFDCIMQDIQFHPVSEMILHVDFLQWFAGKSIKMEIPVHLTGISKGVSNGGTLIHKRRSLTIKALPKNMPEHIDLDITPLDFGKAIKVNDVLTENFEILDTPQASIAVVEIPRALRGKSAAELAGEEGEETEEGAEAAAE
ncbi:50S ribosomal protein L25/general stress protein Ctc [Reichenbachiella carrageenanivorans]|uniref:Large ribosomal subunit protein bL25 n=1 Tax=Reichenbachiella carrageenanivorans TaxID=2979869 RepID=A0ABY6D097_9BACT|nr:50S ribosomal protein L25/general stress protein Ctc [Reichenbachiella carrageenanivorans]UXX79523.1 50S ribosomal protein L25/general stress protein Ctc [Reichenbachiella carrageenanivorans]